MNTIDVRCVRVYLTEHDKYQRLMARLHDVEKVRGVTVFRGISGFGKDGHIHSAQLIDMVWICPWSSSSSTNPSASKRSSRICATGPTWHILSWPAQLEI